MRHLQALLDENSLFVFVIVVDYRQPCVLNSLSFLRVNQPFPALTQTTLVGVEANGEVVNKVVDEEMFILFQIQGSDEGNWIIRINCAECVAAVLRWIGNYDRRFPILITFRWSHVNASQVNSSRTWQSVVSERPLNKEWIYSPRISSLQLITHHVITLSLAVVYLRHRQHHLKKLNFEFAFRFDEELSKHLFSEMWNRDLQIILMCFAASRGIIHKLTCWTVTIRITQNSNLNSMIWFQTPRSKVCYQFNVSAFAQHLKLTSTRFIHSLCLLSRWEN